MKRPNSKRKFLTVQDIRRVVKILKKNSLNFPHLIKCPNCKFSQVVYIKDNRIVPQFGIEKLKPVTSLAEYIKRKVLK